MFKLTLPDTVIAWGALGGCGCVCVYGVSGVGLCFNNSIISVAERNEDTMK